MATIRVHARISRPADEVWKVVSDAGSMEWFPGVEASSLEGSVRSVTFTGDVKVDEEIVTNDDELRRLQYRIVGGAVPVDFHLGTIDVLEDGDGSLVVYSTDVQPDGLGKVMKGSITTAVEGLKKHLEG
jgi:carbon monoxide dehydrogenase subunit G